MAHQVARARRESPHRGKRHLGLAKAVMGELPFTWRAWRDGHIPEWTATLIARETACWRARPSPTADGHEIVTTLPTGHRYRSRPPPVVSTIGHTPIRLDYVLVDDGRVASSGDSASAG